MLLYVIPQGRRGAKGTRKGKGFGDDDDDDDDDDRFVICNRSVLHLLHTLCIHRKSPVKGKKGKGFGDDDDDDDEPETKSPPPSRGRTKSKGGDDDAYVPTFPACAQHCCAVLILCLITHSRSKGRYTSDDEKPKDTGRKGGKRGDDDDDDDTASRRKAGGKGKAPVDDDDDDEDSGGRRSMSTRAKAASDAYAALPLYTHFCILLLYAPSLLCAVRRRAAVVTMLRMMMRI